MIETALTKHELVNEPTESFRIESPDASLPGIASELIVTRQGATQAQVHASEIETVEPAARLLAEMVESAEIDVARYPTSTTMLINLAAALLHARRLGEASDQLRQALAMDATRLDAHVLLAQVLAARGLYDDADREARLVVGQSAERIDGLEMLAEIAALRGSLGEAKALWNGIASKDTRSPVPSFKSATLSLALGEEPAIAIARLRESLRRDPRWAPAQYALGVAYSISGNVAKARRFFEIALKLAPEMADAQLGLARSIEAMGDRSTSVQLLRTGVESHPDRIDLREALAWMYLRQGQPVKAQEQLLIAASTLRDSGDHGGDLPRIANNLGVSYLESRNWGKAEASFRLAVSLGGEVHLIALNNLGLLLTRLNRFDEARAELSRSLDDGDEATFMILSRASYLEGDYKEAANVLEAWRTRGEAGPATYATLGFVLTDGTEEIERAIALLEEGRTRHPDDALIANNLAYALLLTDRVDEASKVLASIGDSRYAAARTNAVVEATEGLLQIKRGDLEAGREKYGRAAEIASEAGDHLLSQTIRQKAHLEFANALTSMNRREEALAETHAGLSLRGRDTYGRDLRTLQQSLSRELGARSFTPK